jgi:hypothetical protein
VKDAILLAIGASKTHSPTTAQQDYPLVIFIILFIHILEPFPDLISFVLRSSTRPLGGRCCVLAVTKSDFIGTAHHNFDEKNCREIAVTIPEGADYERHRFGKMIAPDSSPDAKDVIVFVEDFFAPAASALA